MPTATSARWTAADVPAQTDRLAIVTGANSGIGLETARVLAERGATVVLACRNTDKAKEAAISIDNGSSSQALEIEQIDLSSLASIRAFASRLRDRHPRVDLLINNAGLMWTPKGTTEDGFELQFGTNHLGHFALTGLVLDLLLPVPGSRVVTVSSMGHRTGRIHFDDLQSQQRYGRHRAYAQSKLANLMFTFRTTTPTGRRRRPDHRHRRPPRHHPDRPGAPFTVRHPGRQPRLRVPGVAGRGHGRIADVARRDRSRGARRRVLRTIRIPGTERYAAPGRHDAPGGRCRRPATSMGGVRGVDRGQLPDLKPVEPGRTPV